MKGCSLLVELCLFFHTSAVVLTFPFILPALQLVVEIAGLQQSLLSGERGLDIGGRGASVTVAKWRTWSLYTNGLGRRINHIDVAVGVLEFGNARVDLVCLKR